MNIKQIIVFWVLCFSAGLLGCDRQEPVSDVEKYSAGDISEIEMDLSSWNMKVMVSGDEEIHVAYTGRIKNSDDIKIVQQDDKLLIEENVVSSGDWMEQFSFGKAGEIILYLPTDNALCLEIHNEDGDLTLDSAEVSQLKLENQSGYISMDDMSVQSAEMVSESGDILMAGGSVADCRIETSSGYVTLKSTALESSRIATKSGEVGISNLAQEAETSVSTGSGDISVTYKEAPTDLSFQVTSGSKDITCGIKSAEYTRETDSAKIGVVGAGNYSLSVMSDSGTVVIK